MINKTNNKDQIWAGLFLVGPVVILSQLGKIFAHDSLSEMLYAGLFGGLGGLIGGGLLQLTKTKTTFIKTVSVVLLTGLCVTAIIVANKLYKPTIQTCEVCGYKAIDKTKKECQYCGSLTWEEQNKIKGYNDKQEWLREEQLLWFWLSLDSLTPNIDFYNPRVSEGFSKDENWKPIITSAELIEYNKE